MAGLYDPAAQIVNQASSGNLAGAAMMGTDQVGQLIGGQEGINLVNNVGAYVNAVDAV